MKNPNTHICLMRSICIVQNGFITHAQQRMCMYIIYMYKSLPYFLFLFISKVTLEFPHCGINKPFRSVLDMLRSVYSFKRENFSGFTYITSFSQFFIIR